MPQTPRRFELSLSGQRALFQPGKSRHQRREQYRQQMMALTAVLAVSVVAVLAMVISNWRAAGHAKSVSCEDYPAYCVPLAGGAAGYASLESASARSIDTASAGAPGVVRGIDEDGAPFIGDPAAPIHFRVVSNFACSHCNTFHADDLHRFLQDYVLKGQATLSMVTVAGLVSSAETAEEAALCAGEQGAYWEFADELYRLARTRGTDDGFSPATLKDSAESMGLDGNALLHCVTSNTTNALLQQYHTFATDYGITGTPTLLVRYAGDSRWTVVPNTVRTYANMAALTVAANAE